MRRITPLLAALALLVAGAVPASADSTRYEAENATISQGVVESNHTGYSGAGFVNYDNVTGSSLQWTVNAPRAGTATLALRYANGTTVNRPMDLAVNGATTHRDFNGTGSWDTWATATLTVTLQAGPNTVKATATTANGGPNVDYLDVAVTEAGDDYQAEDATLSQAAVATNHTGYTGTGFVDYVNTAGGYVEWSVQGQGGPAVLVFSYANGTTGNRPLDIAVNGTVIAANTAFQPTATWDTWATVQVPATLAAGTNTVRATATGATGGPNLDRLTVAAPDTRPPTAPGNPRVTATTSSSISLAWDASTDDIGVTGYQVREGGTVVAGPSGTSATVGGLAAAGSHTYTIVATDAAGNLSPASAQVAGTTQPAPTGPGMAVAPYKYGGWGSAGSPAGVMSATGVKWFTLAFILSDGTCNPKWDGTRALTGGSDEAGVNAIRANGGDVIVSVGGWSGTKLGEKCTSASALAAAYQKVISAYRLKALDIDIENTEWASATVRQRVIDALKTVKADNPGLKTVITFGTTPTGPDSTGVDMINRGAASGLQNDIWTIMPFDFGGHSGSMGSATVSALEGLKAKVKAAYGYSDSVTYAHLGLSSMNGKTDEADETVSLADFQTMLGYAQQHHIARLTFWELDRDRACGSGGDLNACSGVSQQPYDYTKIIAQYTG
ncbi:CBM35 domain-containing protein [Nonomuraea sp. NPDC005983]|uniref:CBM35 domain-containing protein n=1 Tax=Nonomuraea sp. NPDC005983 TaxID=3155595 RepID=UPI0033A78B21